MKPLEGIVVLDLTRVLAGPYCTMLLRQLGARIIKIEEPEFGDDARQFGPFLDENLKHSVYFMSINWEKESLALNLKTDDGKKILSKLIEKADVLVENFRPGTLEKLDFSEEKIKAINPHIITASASGFGQTGPLSREAAYDMIVQGLSGLMSITGEENGKPVRVGMSIGDIVTGIFTALGIVSALFQRKTIGVPCNVDVAMLDSLLAILENAILRYSVEQKNPKPLGTRHPSITPFQAFNTKDGQIILAIGNDNLFQKFCLAIERPEWGIKEEFQTNFLRTQNHSILEEFIQAMFLEQTSLYWINKLQKESIPCGLVNEMEDVFKMEQVWSRNMLVKSEDEKYQGIYFAGNPIKLSTDEDSCIRGKSPDIGENSESILQEFLNYNHTEIKQMKKNGVIKQKD